MSSPNPTWKPGDRIKTPEGSVIELDISTMSQPEVYKLIIGAIVPRPIAFVSTISSDGIGNLAPFSFFNGVASNPPCLMISVSRNLAGEKKDTAKNIEATGQFVVNSANEWLLEPLVHCAAEYPYGVNEMSVVGLTPEPSKLVKPSRVKEAALQIECELYKSVEIGDGGPGSTTVFFGRLLFAHVLDKVYQKGRIVYSEFKPIGRLGGFRYTALGEEFEIPVPSVGSIPGAK